MNILSKTLKFIFVIAAAICTLGLLLLAGVISLFPTNQEIRGCMTTKMYQVELCPRSKSYVPISEVSPYLIKTVVLTEDSSFWTHQGFDFDEMKKSLEKNLKTGKFKRGGSTITQQLAKNLFLTEEKTLLRKFREAIITLRLEKVLTKKEILERYLNVVHYGKDLFGIKAAAQFYFRKSPSQLNIIESAFLTFLLPSPQKYSVSYSKHQLTPFAEHRLQQIIDNLYQYQRISEIEYQTAKMELASFLRPTEKAIEEIKSDTLAPEVVSEEETAEPEDD